MNVDDLAAGPASYGFTDMLSRMYEYYIAHPEALPANFQPQLSFDGMERTVCDYIAGMTDNYAVDKYTELFIPAGWHVRG